MTFRSVRSWLWLLASTVSLIGLSGVMAATEETTQARIDCGPAALHALLSIEGRSVDFDWVVARLPSRRGEHSWTGVVPAPQRTRWATVGGLSVATFSGLLGLARWIGRSRRVKRW